MAKTIIEINGVKMEVDMRHAKRIDELRVGDRVKVLIKGYSDYKVYPGTIIGFEPFRNQPTIIVAYIDQGYNAAELKFLHYNASTKDAEIVKAIDDDAVDMSKADVMALFDRMIATKKNEMNEIELKRDYFLRNFQAYWAPVQKPETVEE